MIERFDANVCANAKIAKDNFVNYWSRVLALNKYCRLLRLRLAGIPCYNETDYRRKGFFYGNGRGQGN